MSAGTTADQAEVVARLERLPSSWYHVRLRIIIGFATFFEAFDILSIVYIVPVLAGLWKLTPPQIGLLFSIGFLGQLIGAVVFGWLAERVGRRVVMIVTILLFSLTSLACIFAWDFQSLLVLRLIQGLGLGGEMPVASAYISEFAKAKDRGRFFLVYELVFPAGLLVAALAGAWIVPTFGWQYMFLLGAIPALLALPLRTLVPESPRWLASRGRFKEAVETVEKIERAVSKDGQVALPPVEVRGASSSMSTSSWTDLFKGIYLKRTLSLWSIFFLSYLVTYGLTVWLPTIYRTVFKVTVQEALMYGVVMQVCGFAANACCALLVDKVGRRPWLIAATALSSVPLIALWAANENSLMGLVVAGTLSYTAQTTIALLLYLYTPEIYPTHMRAYGTSVASAWLRGASFVGPMIVGFVLPAYGITAVCLVFGLFSLACAAVCWATAVETKGKVLEKISPWPV